jgi:hypothetical protein
MGQRAGKLQRRDSEERRVTVREVRKRNRAESLRTK